MRSSVGKPREVRNALMALGLGKLLQFVELPDTKEVRGLIAKAPHMLSILDGPDILFPPLEESTLGYDRIRDVVEAVRAERIRAGESERLRSSCSRPPIRVNLAIPRNAPLP